MSDTDRASIQAIKDALREDRQTLRMTELIDERADFRDLREEFYKPMARVVRSAGHKCSVEDLLALTTNSDPFYVKGYQVEQAEWYGGIDDEEDGPTTHPRGMHYSILDKYDDRHGERYVGEGTQWDELQNAARYGWLLGNVPAERVLDGKNSAPEGADFTGSAKGLGPNSYISNLISYRSPRAGDTIRKPKLKRDVESLIERNATAVTNTAFKSVDFYGERCQPYHIEVWCEKSGIIPGGLRSKYDLTTRPADGGEPSAKMCEDAVRLADDRDQGLVVVMLSDFDGKGADMPKSVARKVEEEAAYRDVEAFVHHAALTKEQVAEHDLPFAPGTVPDGAERGTTGAKAFATQNELFAAFAGTNGKIEVNALANEYPDVLREAIEECVEPYYDHDHNRRLEGAISEERDRFEDAITERYNEERDDIDEAYDDLETAIDTYREGVEGDDITDIEDEISDLKDQLDEKWGELADKEQAIREQTDLEAKRDALKTALKVDLRETVSDFELHLPEAETEGRDDAILDTPRSWVDQLAAYREFDYRWEVAE